LGRAGGLRVDSEKGIDELAFLEQPPNTALTVIIQNIVSGGIFSGFGVLRGNEFYGGEHERISFRQGVLVENDTIFARQTR